MMGRAASKFETFEDEVAALHACAEKLQPEKGFAYFPWVCKDQGCMFLDEDEKASFRAGVPSGQTHEHNSCQRVDS